MSQARNHVEKTQLSPEEKIKVTYFHLIKGIAQHTLADMFDVNIGRVNEAIDAVRQAVSDG
jgi:hypothetical protein